MAFLLVIIVCIKLRQNDSTEMKIATYSIVLLLTQYCHWFNIQHIDIYRPTFITRKICKVIDSKNNYYVITSSRSGSCLNRSNIEYRIVNKYKYKYKCVKAWDIFLNNFKCLLCDIAPTENDNPPTVATTKVILFFARNNDNDR